MIRITIVEDLPIVLEGLRVLLDHFPDFKVVAEFRNGKEFVDAVTTIDTDIVLSDIDMPVMNGITATKLALSARPELKIIALSMYNDHRYYYEMLTAGAKGFVSKQSDPDELRDAITKVFAGENYFSRELLHGVIMNMQQIEEVLTAEKKELLQITSKEMNMLTLICKGQSNKELADNMSLSVKTMESNKARLMKKTRTRNNAELIIWAIRNKVIRID